MEGKKVSIIGAGNVGATIAYSLATRGSVKEIVLKDLDTDRANAMTLDISQAANALNMHTIVKIAREAKDLENSDIVVITAGSPRLPGMSRDDLLLINAKIMKAVISEVKEYAPNAIIVPVSNPLDAMVYVALKETGWDRSKIVGMAGILDSARMSHFICEKLGYGAGQITASVMGGHGDDMVPLPNYSTVAGVPISNLLTENEIEEIIEKTKKGGAQIVEYLKTGSAYYAPAKATTIMIEAMLDDTKQIYPCAVLLDGEYGYSDVVSGVPVMLGSKGVEKVIELELTDKQKTHFNKSVNSVKELIDALYTNNFFQN